MLLPVMGWAADFPMTLTDASQQTRHFSEKPQRVVCLVPAITEMIVAFGEADSIFGLTRQDLLIHSGLRKQNVGGYFHPDVKVIEACQPDLIILSPSHEKLMESFNVEKCRFMIMAASTIEEAFSQMEQIGRLFDCEKAAARVIQRNRDQLALVKARLKHIPTAHRKRVARVMAGETLSCPGDDSFQNEMITAAGGIVPHWGKNGFAVPVDLTSWQRFNPQFVYGCYLNAKEVRGLLARDGWKAVDAVRTQFIGMFPCDMTCWVSTRVGAFVQWLSASLYLDTFADPVTAVLTNGVMEEHPLSTDLSYVKQVRVVTHRVSDTPYKSLVVEFKRPVAVLSTLEGHRLSVHGVGNTYVPMHASLGHMANGVQQVQKTIAANLGFEVNDYAGLMTGANMDNLSIQKRTYEDLSVTVFVTAGVRGNALRMSRDIGAYVEHGTINMIVLTNRKLGPNALTGTIISATEAKSAALSDLDVRSSYTAWDHQATGTGTDNIIVVQGEGPPVKFAGGHTKVGELIARAVHAGVTEAIGRQNGIRADRDLFQRLDERKLRLEKLVRLFPAANEKNLLTQLETVLETPFYESFIESAFAISDEYGKGLIKDLAFFDAQCGSVAARLSGKEKISLTDVSKVPLPTVMAKAFGALMDGVQAQSVEKVHP